MTMEGSGRCSGTCSCLGEDRPRVEVITGVAGRRHRPAHEKPRIVEESPVPGETVSAAARRDGVVPNAPFLGRHLMAEWGAMAEGRNEPVAGASEVRRLGRMLGCRTMEVEILRAALEKAGARGQMWLPPPPKDAR